MLAQFFSGASPPPYSYTHLALWEAMGYGCSLSRIEIAAGEVV